MKTLIRHDTGHTVYAHQLDDADRATAAADLITRLLPAFEVGIHTADLLTLAHEAERLDALPASAVIRAMRAIVAAEQTARLDARAEVTGRG